MDEAQATAPDLIAWQRMISELMSVVASAKRRRQPVVAHIDGRGRYQRKLQGRSAP